MGEVYKRDTRLDRTIKILPETLAADPQFRERFDREARAISQLEHPHICALYDVGEQDGTAFLVMSPEQLEGREADVRSDIFAFGAVVNEMVTGRKAFEGASQASVIATIAPHVPSHEQPRRVTDGFVIAANLQHFSGKP